MIRGAGRRGRGWECKGVQGSRKVEGVSTRKLYYGFLVHLGGVVRQHYIEFAIRVGGFHFHQTSPLFLE